MPDEYVDLSITAPVAERYGVEARIHTGDFIFMYHLDGHDKRPETEAASVYFADGAQSTDKLRTLLREYFPGRSGLRLLEFASGYGCLTRHLVKHKDILTTACDIHPEAVEFIKTHIGADAVLSARDPDALSLPAKYDAVFALSFFSHMPPATFKRWVNALLDRVADGGLLIFTTHGRVGQAQIKVESLGPEGRWFAPLSEQRDLPTSDYGTMLVTPGFVFDTVAHRDDYALRFYCEAFWWGTQDTYIFQKVEDGAARGMHPAGAAWKTERDVLEQRIRALTCEVQMLRASTSWKLAAPLRMVKRVLKEGLLF
jgi:SAM-dependent methyltransferase